MPVRLLLLALFASGAVTALAAGPGAAVQPARSVVSSGSRAVTPTSPRKAPAKRTRAPRRAAVPPRALADLPVVNWHVSTSEGCVGTRTASTLAPRLGTAAPTVEAFFSASGVPVAADGPCVPYVMVTGGAEGVATLHLPAASWQVPPTDTPPAPFCDQTRRVIEVPASDLPIGFAGPFLDVPARVRWQLDVLVPDMLERLALDDRDSDEEGEGAARDPVVRIVLDQRGSVDAERLQSLELVDPATRHRLDGAWWVERADGSGVLFGMRGADYERLLWNSPVDFDRLSRGVGPSTRLVRRTVRRKGSREKRVVTRVVKPRGYHLGIDLLAPRGAEVHAVADATVAFAGTRRGFGKLVVLDHGHGYQTYYAHLTAISRGLAPGDVLLRGDVLGLVGSTGRSTGPHLHLETRLGQDYVDPLNTTRQLEFWVLTAEEQAWIAQQMLAFALPVDDDQPAFRGVSLVVPGNGGGAPRTEPWASQPGACRAYTQAMAPDRPEVPRPVVRRKTRSRAKAPARKPKATAPASRTAPAAATPR